MKGYHEIKKAAETKGVKFSFGYVDTKRGSEGRFFLNDKPYTAKQAEIFLNK